MKKKLIGVVVAVIVALGVAYLGGVAYSRHVFAEQMAQTVARLDASPDLSVTQQALSQGFFHTDGKLMIGMNNVTVDQRPVRLELPFRARHGILSTTFDGSLDVRAQGQGQRLFADYLSPGKPIDLKARIANLEGTGDLTLTFPTIDRRDPAHGVTLHGGVLHLSGQPDDVSVDGRLQAFALVNEGGEVALGPLTFTSRYSDAEETFGQRSVLDIDSLALHRAGALPLAFSGIHYTGQTSVEKKELRYLIHLVIGDASVSQQRLGSATMSASLDRINGEAAARFFKGLQDRFASRQASAAPDTQQGWLDMIAPLERPFFAMFNQSPRLSVDQLQIESPMLEQTMQLEGDMTFDGSGIERMRVDDLRSAQGRQAFYDRLHGDFTLTNTPPLLALIAGVAPDQNTLNLTFDDNTLSINGQPWYSLD